MGLLNAWWPKPDLPTRPHFIMGLDLGKSRDFTALAIIRTHVRFPDFSIGPESIFECVHLQRYKLGTSYPAIAREVRELCRREPLATFTPRLAIDATGVGSAVVDIFRQAELHADLSPITIHGGNETTTRDGGFNVPKRELVSTTQALLQTGRLKIASQLPLTSILVAELQNFEVEISQSGFDSYNARSGQHDDLVLALAMALWLARNPEPYFGPLDSDIANAIIDYWGGR